MKHKLGKFFWEFENDNRKLRIFDYDPAKDCDYYGYVKHYHQFGYHQLILTSDLILDLVSYYFLEKHLSISKIEFLEDDLNLNNRIQSLIESCKSDRAYFAELIKELNFISEESSIDIKRVSLINRINQTEKPKSLFFQVNGIIGIDEKNYTNEIEVLIKKLQR